MGLPLRLLSDGSWRESLLVCVWKRDGSHQGGEWQPLAVQQPFYYHATMV